jgi:hypothetical protein
MKLKSLILYFLKNSPKTLGRTELMKYIYLFEYYFYQMFGKNYTNLTFERYKFGPNEYSVIDAGYSLEQEGFISIEAYKNYYNGTSYNYHYVKDDGNNYTLDSHAEFVADFIIDLLRNKNYRGVIDIAYNTPPMREIIEEEKSKGVYLYGRVIDMSKSEPIFKSTRQKRLEARKRLSLKQNKRGSDEEYYAHLVEQYKKFEDTRRRASFVE